MGEDFEILAPRDGDERHSRLVGELYGGGRRRRDSDQNRGIDPRRLLDQFNRNTACHQDHAIRCRAPVADERADEFVERIVAADILAQGDKALTFGPEPGAMDGMGDAVKVCAGSSEAIAATIAWDETFASAVTRGSGRIAASRLSMPQRPHPVGPAMLRRRLA